MIPQDVKRYVDLMQELLRLRDAGASEDDEEQLNDEIAAAWDRLDPFERDVADVAMDLVRVGRSEPAPSAGVVEYRHAAIALRHLRHTQVHPIGVRVVEARLRELEGRPIAAAAGVSNVVAIRSVGAASGALRGVLGAAAIRRHAGDAGVASATASHERPSDTGEATFEARFHA